MCKSGAQTTLHFMNTKMNTPTMMLLKNKALISGYKIVFVKLKQDMLSDSRRIEYDKVR